MRTSGRHLQRQIFPIGVLIVLIGVCAAGYARKAARVNVTPEDVQRANQASQEGDIAFGRKDYYAALIRYLEAVRLNPNSELFFNRLGISYSQLKFYDQAREAFLRSIQINPKYVYPINNMGSVFFAQRNLKKAEKYFKKAISMKGNEASFHLNLGSVYLEKKKRDKAMAEWRKGLALDPDAFSRSNSVTLAGALNSSPMERSFFIARLFAAAGNVDRAIENLKLAINQGFSDTAAIDKEPDFNPVRNDPRFEDFLKEASLLIKLKSKVGLPEDTPSFPIK